jgi:hypothetical protein
LNYIENFKYLIIKDFINNYKNLYKNGIKLKHIGVNNIVN